MTYTAEDLDRAQWRRRPKATLAAVAVLAGAGVSAWFLPTPLNWIPVGGGFVAFLFLVDAWTLGARRAPR